MTGPATVRDLAPGLDRLFLFDATETAYDITSVEGRIPEWLLGTYYVNGPARFERAGARYKHWLDGDGMVSSLRFSRDSVRFTSRFIQTRKKREEDAAGRFLYRGFGTAFPGDTLRRGVMLEPPVNVSVYPYGGRLLAFGEQTLPFELDPATLETLGEYDFDGRLNELSPFAAHAKIDGHLLNFGVSYASSRPVLNTYEFDSGGALLRRRRYPLPLPHSMHDFGFTPRRMVFYLSPLLMDFERFRQGASVAESLRWEPERGSRILVTPRAAERAEPFEVEAGAGYCLHFINCHEEGNRLVVDILELEEPVYREYQPVPDLFATVTRCRPVRYVFDAASKKLTERVAMDYDLAPDFPAIDVARAGRSYDDFWMLGISTRGGQGRKFFDQVAHGSWTRGAVRDIWQTPPGEYLGGEPVHAANPEDPEDAVVIVEHFAPANDAASFLLFNAFAVEAGPIARLRLEHRLHPGFHACFWRT